MLLRIFVISAKRFLDDLRLAPSCVVLQGESMRSFPSGHSSTSMAGTLYVTLVCWGDLSRYGAARRGWRRSLYVRGVYYVLGRFCFCICVCLCWSSFGGGCGHLFPASVFVVLRERGVPTLVVLCVPFCTAAQYLFFRRVFFCGPLAGTDGFLCVGTTA